jgi:hypothetical protein
VKCDLGSVCPLKGSNCYVSIYFWLQVFEVAPSLFMVEMSKNNGDTIEYQNFFKNLSKGLKDIVWTAEGVDTAAGAAAK